MYIKRRNFLQRSNGVPHPSPRPSTTISAIDNMLHKNGYNREPRDAIFPLPFSFSSFPFSFLIYRCRYFKEKTNFERRITRSLDSLTVHNCLFFVGRLTETFPRPPYRGQSGCQESYPRHYAHRNRSVSTVRRHFETDAIARCHVVRDGHSGHLERVVTLLLQRFNWNSVNEKMIRDIAELTHVSRVTQIVSVGRFRSAVQLLGRPTEPSNGVQSHLLLPVSRGLPSDQITLHGRLHSHVQRWTHPIVFRIGNIRRINAQKIKIVAYNSLPGGLRYSDAEFSSNESEIYFVHVIFHAYTTRCGNAIRTGLGENAQRFTEHPVPVFVLAKHHELVLPSRIQIVYRRLGDFSRQDLHRSPLGGVGRPVPEFYTHIRKRGIVSPLRLTVLQAGKGREGIFAYYQTEYSILGLTYPGTQVNVTALLLLLALKLYGALGGTFNTINSVSATTVAASLLTAHWYNPLSCSCILSIVKLPPIIMVLLVNGIGEPSCRVKSRVNKGRSWR